MHATDRNLVQDNLVSKSGPAIPGKNFKIIQHFMQSVIRISLHPMFSRTHPNSSAGDTNLKLGVVAMVRAIGN